MVAASAVLAATLVLVVGLEVGGYDAGAALGALWSGAFGSGYALFSATLVRAIPLTIIGLGFALAFRGGALNIGAEGQFYAGAIAATWVGVHAGGWPSIVVISTVLLLSAAAGALWMLLPVVLKVRYGVFEAISTLLLNFVALSLVSYMVTGPLREQSGIYPQSDPLAAAARLPFFPGTRLHLGALLAILLAAVLWVVLRKTLWGFQLRALGASPRAAQVTGRVDGDRMLAVALMWSGALAGLAGGLEVSGVSYALFQNLSPGYGFTAIAVALLARLHPGWIVLSGILFGALEAGAGAMQRDAGVPSVAVYVVEAVVIVTILVFDALLRRGQVVRGGETEEARA
jgi:simple sugar transport system permease protein